MSCLCLESSHNIFEIVGLSGGKCSINFWAPCGESNNLLQSSDAIRSLNQTSEAVPSGKYLISKRIWCTHTSGSLSPKYQVLQPLIQQHVESCSFVLFYIQRPFHCTSAITTAGFPDLTRGDQGGQASTGISSTVQRGH